MTIRTQADIAALEKMPLAERVRHGNMLELLRHAGSEHANRTAIRFLSGTTPADPVRDVRYDELLQRVIQTANLLRSGASEPMTR